LIPNIYLLVTAAKNKTLGFLATFFKKLKLNVLRIYLLDHLTLIFLTISFTVVILETLGFI